MGIYLPEETQQLIDEEISAGRFQDAASLVDTALRYYLLARELTKHLSQADVEAKIARGLTSLERGEGADGEAFMADLLDSLDRRGTLGLA